MKPKTATPMSLLNNLNVQIRERVLPALPASVREVFEGGSRKNLIARIDQRLLLVNNELFHMDTGRSLVIEPDSLVKQSSGGSTQALSTTVKEQSPPKNLTAEISPEQIAEAASQLLKNETATGIILYLPPSDFVATSISMPGVSRDNLMSALKLQADNLFPSLDDTLDLTLGGHLTVTESSSTALWFAQKAIDSLFEAFKKVDLFLVALAPRNLSDLQQKAIVDFDSRGGTLVELSNGVVSSWLHINQLDLNDNVLNSEWLNALEAIPSDKILRREGADSFKEINHSTIPSDYCFIPQGAMSLRKREEKRRNIGLAAGAFVLLLMLGAIPFLIQSFQFRTLAASLKTQRVESATARDNRSVVVNFENEWGPVVDFPQQEVQQAMFTLQSILQPDQLASFELSEGVIKIQGTSTEPQAILQRLEQDPMFTEVVFSRATNNSRYYIDLRLSTINFEGYMVRYFPDA